MTTTTGTPRSRTTGSVRAAATGRPAYSVTLPNAPESAHRARILASIALAAWGMEVLADDATLVVSELVGNAARHAHCKEIRASVARVSGDRVRISVTDKDKRPMPVAMSTGEDAESGRGLAVVASLSARWTVDYKRWGKTVWCELGTPAVEVS